MRFSPDGIEAIARLIVGRSSDPVLYIQFGSGTRAEDDDASLETPHTDCGLGIQPLGTLRRSSGTVKSTGYVTRGYWAEHILRVRDTTFSAPTRTITEYAILTADMRPIARHLLAVPQTLRAGESVVLGVQILPIDGGDVVRTGLVRHYRFDENGGQTLFDHSGFDQHGTHGSEPDADTNDPLYNGEVYAFGVDDYVAIPAVTFGSDFTIMFYADRTDTTHHDMVLGNLSGNDTAFGFGSGNTAFCRVVNGGSGASPALSGGGDDSGPAVILTFVRRVDGTVAFSANGGAFVDLYSGAAVPGATTLTVIGRDNSTNVLNGRVYGMLLYDRELSLAEVSHNCDYLFGTRIRETA